MSWDTLSASKLNLHKPQMLSIPCRWPQIRNKPSEIKLSGTEYSEWESLVLFLLISLNQPLINNKRTINLNRVPTHGSHKVREKEIKSSLRNCRSVIHGGGWRRKGKFIRTVAGSHFYFTVSPFDKGSDAPRSNFIFEVQKISFENYPVATTTIIQIARCRFQNLP